MPEATKQPLLEVERKFRITNAQASALPEMLLSFGFHLSGETVMKDTFLPTENPSDMLRVREEDTVKPDGSVAKRILLTAKHWKIFDDGSKEREEQEEVIAPLTRDSFIRLGEKIAGGKLLSFAKKRILYDGRLGEFDAVVSIDFCEDLGEYSGYYSEIEVLVASDRNLSEVREQIQAHATRLLGADAEMETKSYMDMLRLAGRR